jgi:hypothetical protein
MLASKLIATSLGETMEMKFELAKRRKPQLTEWQRQLIKDKETMSWRDLAKKYRISQDDLRVYHRRAVGLFNLNNTVIAHLPNTDGTVTVKAFCVSPTPPPPLDS